LAVPYGGRQDGCLEPKYTLNHIHSSNKNGLNLIDADVK
jgi:hypothetical protein